MTSRINENTNLGIQEIYDRIMNLKRKDYAIPCNKAVFSKNEDGTYHIGAEGIGTFPLTEYAVEQLNNRWSGLNTYSRTLHELQLIELYMHNVKSLLAQDERKVVVRTMQPNGVQYARAVV